MTIKVFISGQSNALGRGTDGPSFSGVSSDVTVWDNVNPLGANGTSFVSAATAQAGGTFENTDRNNAGVWFCDKLARTIFDTVTMAVVARGATTISAWDPAEVTTPMLQECIDVWTATGQGPADVFIWQHGEGDLSTPTATYQAAFLALLSDLEAAGVISQSTAVITTGLVENSVSRVAFGRETLAPLVSQDARFAFASSHLLPTSDGTHFSGDALYALGARRIYAAWQYVTAKMRA